MTETSKKRILVLNDTRVDLHHGCHRVMGCIEKNLKKNNMECTFIPAHQKNLAADAMKFLINNTQLVLINAEGTVHHDRQAGKELLDAGLYAKKIGKKVAFINSTWQQNSHESLKILEKFDYVSVRESLSSLELTSAGIKHDIVPDLSFYGLAPLDGCKSSGVILYTDSVKREDAELLLAECRRSGKGEFLPMTLTYQKYVDSLRVVRRQYSKLDIKNYERFKKTTALWGNMMSNKINCHSQFIQKICESEGVVSGRFHMTCMAIGLFVPVMALESNSHKVQGLLTDIGLESRLIKGDNISVDVKNLSYSDAEITKIKKYIKMAKFKIEKSFNEILELVE